MRSTSPIDRAADIFPVELGRSGCAVGFAGCRARQAWNLGSLKPGPAPLKLRSLVVKPAMLGSNLGVLLAGFGLATQAAGLIWVGIILFSAFVVFTLVTLPVEFDASKRAVVALREIGIISPQETAGAGAVLRAAALTYVAAAVTAVLQLLYFLMRAGLLSRNQH